MHATRSVTPPLDQLRSSALVAVLPASPRSHLLDLQRADLGLQLGRLRGALLPLCHGGVQLGPQVDDRLRSDSGRNAPLRRTRHAQPKRQRRAAGAATAAAAQRAIARQPNSLPHARHRRAHQLSRELRRPLQAAPLPGRQPSAASFGSGAGCRLNAARGRWFFNNPGTTPDRGIQDRSRADRPRWPLRRQCVRRWQVDRTFAGGG
jgi:hypothetical protein